MREKGGIIHHHRERSWDIIQNFDDDERRNRRMLPCLLQRICRPLPALPNLLLPIITSTLLLRKKGTKYYVAHIIYETLQHLAGNCKALLTYEIQYYYIFQLTPRNTFFFALKHYCSIILLILFLREKHLSKAASTWRTPLFFTFCWLLMMIDSTVIGPSQALSAHECPLW
jgi:hypothetical protein